MQAIINSRHNIDLKMMIDIQKLGYSQDSIILTKGNLQLFKKSHGLVCFEEWDEARTEMLSKHQLGELEALVWSMPTSLQSELLPMLIEAGVRPIVPLTERIKTGTTLDGKPQYKFVYTGLSEITEFKVVSKLVGGRLPQSQR
jgi:hypothetical protein